MSAIPPPLLHSDPLALHPAVYAEVVDELSLTVQQLLLAALSRARQLPPMQASAASPPVLQPQRPMPLPSLAPAQLSGRENEVLQRIAAGDSNKMIARALGLSPHTVKRHVANILSKLDLRSRGQAAAWWMARLPQRRQDH